MPLFKWSKTAASNATADPTINWQEGMPPSAVNDSARAEMAAVKKWHDDITGTLTTTGSSTAYAVTTNSAFDSLSNLAGSLVAFVPHTTSGDNPTLNVDALGAKPIRMAPGAGLPAGVLVQGTPYVATYYTTNGGELILHGFYGNPYNIPIGGFLDYGGATAPNSSFVLTFGQAISRTTYATLFSLLGTTYGPGDGSTTFNIPDLRGRVVAGKDDMGGTSANRLTNQSGGLDGDVLGATGGGETHTLTQAQLPAIAPSGSVSVTLNDPGHGHPWRQGNGGGDDPSGGIQLDFQNQTDHAAYAGAPASTAGQQIGGNTTGITVQSATFTGSPLGSSQVHNNVQPTIILNKLLRII